MADYSKCTREWLYDACYILASSIAEHKEINSIYESSLSEEEQRKHFGNFINEKLKLYPEREATMLIIMGGCEMH